MTDHTTAELTEKPCQQFPLPAHGRKAFGVYARFETDGKAFGVSFQYEAFST